MAIKYKSYFFYIIKILDIFYVTNLYLFLGVLSSVFIKKYFIIPYDKSRLYILNLLYLLLIISFISLSVFLIRQLIRFYIPSPFNNIAGFKHSGLKEINGNVVLAFAFLMFLKDNLYEYTSSLYGNII